MDACQNTGQRQPQAHILHGPNRSDKGEHHPHWHISFSMQSRIALLLVLQERRIFAHPLCFPNRSDQQEQHPQCVADMPTWIPHWHISYIRLAKSVDSIDTDKCHVERRALLIFVRVENGCPKTMLITTETTSADQKTGQGPYQYSKSNCRHSRTSRRDHWFY